MGGIRRGRNGQKTPELKIAKENHGIWVLREFLLADGNNIYLSNSKIKLD